MRQEESSKAEAGFLRTILLAIGTVLLLSFIITTFDPDLNELLKNNKVFYLLSSLVYFYLSILISNVKYHFESMYKFILISIYIHTLFFCLLHCHYSYFVFLNYIAISIAVLIITNVRSAALVLLISGIICCFSRPISEFFKINNPNYIFDDNNYAVKKFETISIIYSIFFITYISYFYVKLKKIKNSNKRNETQITEKAKDLKAVELNTQNDKFENLYNEIIRHFETQKPFTEPEFNIGTLSKSLKTNSTYISKALNQIGNIKFNSLVNDYRIKQVVEELDKKKYKIHTLETIYTKAGFTQQSTFNRIFKEHNGITPTEYIENLEKP